jgi:hypothetical protein
VCFTASHRSVTLALGIQAFALLPPSRPTREAPMTSMPMRSEQTAVIPSIRMVDAKLEVVVMTSDEASKGAARHVVTS